jgi:transcriptional regulator with XRE-family HTH domain
MTVGDRIRDRRVALGISQRDLAVDGVSYTYISRLEANRRQPSVKALRQLARRLDVSVHWLETGDQDPAHELAQLVLSHPGQPLPKRAATLARSVLAD